MFGRANILLLIIFTQQQSDDWPGRRGWTKTKKNIEKNTDTFDRGPRILHYASHRSNQKTSIAMSQECRQNFYIKRLT